MKVLFAALFMIQTAVLLGTNTVGDRVTIGNDIIERTLTFDGQVWKTTAFSRVADKDEMIVDSDEFHLLYFNDSTATIDQFLAVGDPVFTENDGIKTLAIRYCPRVGALQKVQKLPNEIVIRYSIQPDHYFVYKQIELIVDRANEKALDRLEVERFSTTAKSNSRWQRPAGLSRR